MTQTLIRTRVCLAACLQDGTAGFLPIRCHIATMEWKGIVLIAHFSLFTGGYKLFSSLYPEYIRREDSENCPVITGLSSLNLVEPLTPASSEATPSPSFPIEVIRNLYLGNAKCSMDSEALLKNNIRYILNVTPNLPNHFEGSSDVDVTYKQIPINDHWSQNLSLYFPEAIAFIGELKTSA